MRNWEDVLPKHVAKAQHAWDRRMRVIRAINSGATRKEIANAMGVSTGRVGQIIWRADRDVRYGNKSPAETYLNELPWFDEITALHIIFERKKRFDASTIAGRRAIKTSANKFLMGKAP